MEKLPIYDLEISEKDDESGVYCVSQVDYPAIMKDFMKFSEKNDRMEFKQTFKQTVGMKQYLTGPVLVPNFLIYRETSDGAGYYVRFSEAEIEKIVKKFFKNGFTHNTNQQHKVELDSNYVFESWIVIDPENDKSKAMGFEDIAKGTWMMTYHIPDTEYWNKEIMTGNAKGFSIEGFFDQVQAKMQKELNKSDKKQIENKMKDKTLLAKLKDLVFRTNKLTLSDHKLQDGRMIYVNDETKEAFLIAEDESQSVLPDGEYILEDGNMINVLDGLVVDAPAEPVAEVAAEKEDPAVEPASEDLAKELKETNEQLSKMVAQITVIFDKQKSKIDILEEKLSKQGKAISKLEKSFEEFSKAPAAKELNFSKTIDIEEKSQGKFIDFNRAYELKHK